MRVVYNIEADDPLGPIIGATKEFATNHYPPSDAYEVRICIPSLEEEKKGLDLDFDICPEPGSMIFCLDEESEKELVIISLMPNSYHAPFGGSWGEADKEISSNSKPGYEEFCEDMIALCKKSGWKLIVSSEGKSGLPEDIQALCSEYER